MSRPHSATDIHIEVRLRPDGVTIRRMLGRSLVVASAPLSHAHALLSSREGKRGRIYVLSGAGSRDHPVKIEIYIGKGDVEARLRSHRRDPRKKFADSLTVVANEGDGLINGDHWTIIEQRLVSVGKASGSADVDNRQNADLEKYDPEIRDQAEELLVDLVKLLAPIDPWSCIPFYRHPDHNTENGAGKTKKRAEPISLELRAGPTVARARDEGDRVVLLKNSLIRSKLQKSASRQVHKEFARAMAEGLLRPTADANVLRLAADLPLRSRTGAAELAAGRNINPKRWRIVQKGR